MATRPLAPPRLNKGGTLTVVSPSWRGGELFPERVARGVRDLAERAGLDVVVAPAPEGRRARAEELTRALRDPESQGVLWMIGGVTAAELLDLIDYEGFAAAPKVLCGYSGATVLHHALYARTGAVTFYGPALLSEFAEAGGTPALTMDSFVDVTMRGWTGNYPRSADVFDEFVAWGGDDREHRPDPDPAHRGSGGACRGGTHAPGTRRPLTPPSAASSPGRSPAPVVVSLTCQNPHPVHRIHL